jgi:hypothetical protein
MLTIRFAAACVLTASAMQVLSVCTTPAAAQNRSSGKKDRAALAMPLGPPGPDPTPGAARAIAEITL